MFQTGENVVYGSHGVCSIIGMETKRVDRKEVTYLVLEPLAQPGDRYLVPTHNPAAMGKVKTMLTREELETLFRSAPVRTENWICDENQRKQIYRELISSGDRQMLMAMVHTLYCHKVKQGVAGKKLHVCDENFLRDAEKRLISEVSVVMDLDFDQARTYVRSSLKE